MATIEKTQETPELSQSSLLWAVALLLLLTATIMKDPPGGVMVQLIGYAAATAAFGVLARFAKRRGDKVSFVFARIFMALYMVIVFVVLGWLVYDLLVG